MRLTHEEYQRRLAVIDKAMALYGEQVGYNINKALELLNEPDFEISIPADSFRGMTGSEFDQWERVRCPMCNEVMNIRNVPPNDDGIVTQAVCANPDCDVVLDFDLTIDDWRRELSGHQ